MRRPPLPAARTFNTAPRFSVPNFGMRTNAPNTRLGRRSFHESHPGDTTFSFLFLLFLLFFFAKKKKEERRGIAVQNTVRNKSERTTRDHRSFPFNQHRERVWYGKGGERCGAFMGAKYLFFCCATSSKSEILHRGEIKK